MFDGAGLFLGGGAEKDVTIVDAREHGSELPRAEKRCHTIYEKQVWTQFILPTPPRQCTKEELGRAKARQIKRRESAIQVKKKKWDASTAVNLESKIPRAALGRKTKGQRSV